MKFYRNNLKVGGRDLTFVTINQEDGEVVTEVKAVEVPKVHHIHILDRSGSMSGSINNLIDQVQSTLEIISKEDLVSIIWFSSPGQYKTLVKGATKSPELITLLNTLRSVIGTTCFSDPIREAGTIVQELKALCPNISITLFTDGCPVVPWGETAEETKCIGLVKEFKKDILSFNTVGYGYYYNQNFLKNLSSQSEFGIFTHSTQISEYLNIFKNNFERISESKVEQVHIEYPFGVDGVYLNRKFAKMENLELYLSKLDKNKNQFFVVSDKGDFKFHYNGEARNSKDLKEEVADPTVKNFLYAYSYGLYYANRRKEALEILSYLGDKALIDSHMSAFTYDETAAHQSLLEKATLNTGDRMKEGAAKANYLPAKDAFCVYDVLNLLNSSDAYYLPFHPEAEEYKRIGKKTEDKNNMFEMTSESVVTPFSDFVFNKEKCNLSVRMNIPGMVKLNAKSASEVGLPNQVESFLWRNHTIIKNGNLNMKRIVSLMPKDLFEQIQSKKKILEEVTFKDKTAQKDIENAYGKKYVCAVVKLNKLPVINALYNEDLSASKVFNLASELLKEECYQKYLNYYWKQFVANATAAQKKVGVFEGKTAAQIKVLEEHGIEKSGAYAGVEKETPKNDECDSYETRSFEFVFKGISSLPKVEEVAESIKANKKLTVAFEKMAEAKERIERAANKAGIDLGKAVVATRDWLQEQLQETKGKLFETRGKLAGIKMAKLLTGDSFEGFTLDAKKNFVYDASGMTLIMKMEKVKEYF